MLESVKQISSLPHLKGLILGTRGVGKGLDDPELNPVWDAVAQAGLVVFLHPHYGVDARAWGDVDNGHVLPLALGFPFETTVVSKPHCWPSASIANAQLQAATRMILSGVFDRHPNLRLLLAHSGGALPQLSSRLASCIAHDPVVASRLKHDARYYLGKIYYDAVSYGPEEMRFTSDVISRADSYVSSETARVAADCKVGAKRMMFGTDHPFFPPLSSTEMWKSVVENLNSIDTVQGWGQQEKDSVRGGNALELFGL